VAEPSDVQRRLVAVFAADVEGYSRLMGADEVGTLKGLTERRAILDKAIAEHRGRIANTAGDSVLAEFGSAVDAVQCAVNAQLALTEANENLSTDKRINFRIGIHVGDVMVRAGDLFGDGVNIAARLQTLAQPGGVCVSGETYGQVRKVLPIAFTDLGAQPVKNIEEPVRAFALAGPAASTATTISDTTKPLPLPDKPSIAVLPFQNMSGDPEQDYFADGMVEDIITALSRFKELFVIARNSSFTYKGKAVDIKRVGRELGVRYVLEGSVRKAGGRLRITGQLIEAATNKHLWADKFDGSVESIFDFQDELTSHVVTAIQPALQQAEIQRMKRKPPADLDSYDWFLRGMALQDAAKPHDAMACYRAAVEKDEGYADAHAMIANCFGSIRSARGFPLTSEEHDEALSHARTAVRLGDDNALALARAGHALVYLNNEYDRGSAVVEQAVVLNPNLHAVLASRGWVHIMCSNAEQAVESFLRLSRISPLEPRRTITWMGLAWGCFLLERYDDGYNWAERALALQKAPNVFALGTLVANAVMAGHTGRAQEVAAQIKQIAPDFRVSFALDIFRTRRVDFKERISEAFRATGVPE
jgi:TolB-like protein/class 3 adenylate cyclase